MRKRLLFLTLHFIIILSLLLTVRPTAQAQKTFQWTEPKRIPNYHDKARPPIMVADSTGGVHAFNYELHESVGSAIYYRHWSMEQGWSPPVDIIIPVLGSGGATVQGAFIDERGILSLIYYDGSELIGDIYYTWTYASVADRAQSWSKPVPVGTSAGPVVYASITGDDQGRIFILYGGQRDGIGLYQVYSLDHGSTWSVPTVVSLVNQENKWPYSIKTMLDSQGRLHATWSLITDRGIGDQVRYARMDSPGKWSHEVVLATRTGNEYSVNWPSIVVRGDEVMVIYQDSFPATRWMIYSKNGGDSWSLPIRPFDYIGEYENAVLLKDSSDNIYIVLGNRIGDPEIHGMWFSKWNENHWSNLEPIISGPVTPVFDPSAPQAVVVQGNIIMAVWWHNVSNEQLSGAWYSYTYLDSPALPVKTLPVPTAAATPTEATAPQATLSPSPTPTAQVMGKFDTTPDSNTNPSFAVYVGALPVLLIVIIIFVSRSFHKPFKE